MAESKNNFFKAKMNKDLDSRLLESSEYRDALNISVGKSEDHSVGSLQNILGNELLIQATQSGSAPFESNSNLVCIGYFVDNENSRIFQFLTEYTDPSPSLINLPTEDQEMKITVYNAVSNSATYTTLVSGSFLNLSTTNLITGVNLVENLLFWTDNRNQPRKINIDSALSNPATSTTPYYTDVTQISVAKYAPFKSPTLYEEVSVSMEDIASETYLGQTIIVVPESNTLQLGDQLVNEDLGTPITAGDFAVITKKGTVVLGTQEIYIAGNHTIPASEKLTFYRTTMTSASDEANINGNDNFLTDKFVRFSYRFKFDDNEYSLMAPFTQPIFIPLQKGYFTSGDEDAAYASTVLEWMQNRANGVRLNIELPDIGNDIKTSYKISSMDILYKESDSLAVKVVETIPVANIQEDSPTINIYTYTYSSQKPKKTLQEAEIIRVYDKVPIRALAQESVGNRIVYGNFINQNTPPANLNYSVQVIEKNTPRNSWYEYPNHTLKQNRAYQVGVVLADKFGRQSSVILSNGTPFAPIDDLIFGASSVFLPYKNDNWTIPVKEWLGEVLAITFNSTVTSVRDEGVGTPGLYATISGNIPDSNDGFEITGSTQSEITVDGITTYTYEYTPQSLGTPQSNYPITGNYLKGKYKDYVEVLTASEGILTTTSPIDDLYIYNPINIPDIKYSYSINELGWYSYKIVVKQTDQEYYNVYVPGMLAGYPIWQTSKIDGTNAEDTVFPPNEENSTCHFVLINDNINKVPRDLSEVGPNQRQYRSSVKLWGRVENVLLNPSILPDPDPLPITTNRQYYPGITPDTVSTIAPSNDLNFLLNSMDDNPKGSAEFNIYQLNTSPLIARVSTVNQVGVIGNYATVATAPNAFTSMSPFLGVYETDPVKSTLDIFYETSTSDYISNLNWDINVGSNGVVGFSPIVFIYNEHQPLGQTAWSLDTGASDSSWITDEFWFINASGTIVSDIDSVNFGVKNGSGTNVSSNFGLVEGPTPGTYRIKIVNNNIYFGLNLLTNGSFSFTFLVTNTVGLDTYIIELNATSSTYRISNWTPNISTPEEDNIYFVPINQPGGETTRIIDSIGGNGCSNTSQAFVGADLYWDIAAISPVNDQSFIISHSTGDIRLANNTPTIGVSTWNINLQDSSTTLGLAIPEPNIIDPSLGSLDTDRVIQFNVEDRKIWCGYWNTAWLANAMPLPPGYRLNTYGYLNICRMLKPGETITNCQLRLTAYQQYNQTSFQPVTVPTTLNIDPLQIGVISWVASPSLKVVTAGQAWVEYLQFTGAITLTGPDGDRIINETFISQGREPVAPVLYGSICQQCVFFPNDISSPPEPYYISEDSADWMITNNSETITVYWRGVSEDNEEIIGEPILPGDFVASTGNLPSGTFPRVRLNTLRATGQLVTAGEPVEGVGILSTITYTV